MRVPIWRLRLDLAARLPAPAGATTTRGAASSRP